MGDEGGMKRGKGTGKYVDRGKKAHGITIAHCGVVQIAGSATNVYLLRFGRKG